MTKIVVAGASLAAVSAVEGLRDRGFDGEILLVGAEDELAYTRPPLSKEALEHGVDLADVQLHDHAWYEERGVELMLGTRASAVDTGRKVLATDRGGEVAYDRLLVATGSSARRLSVPVVTRVHVIRSVGDAVGLREAMLAGRSIAVVGAGFLGLEVASTATRLGLDVTVVDVAESPLSTVFGAEVGRWFTELHEQNGVRIVCPATVTGIDEIGGRGRVHLGDGRTVEADVVLVAVGGIPETAWLDGSGIDASRGVACGTDLMTSAPDVAAAGDVARWHNGLFDETMRLEHWTNAVEQGRHAAGSLLGEREAFTSVPYFWTNQHTAKARFVGRACPADDLAIVRRDDRSFVALFGREGRLRGALCVNAPRQLAQYRSAVAERVLWSDVLTADSAVTSPGTSNK